MASISGATAGVLGVRLLAITLGETAHIILWFHLLLPDFAFRGCRYQPLQYRLEPVKIL